MKKKVQRLQKGFNIRNFKSKNSNTLVLITLLAILPFLAFTQPCQTEADFDIDATMCPVTFTGSNSVEVTHYWNFGDGNTASESEVSNTYPAGQHTWLVTHVLNTGQSSFVCQKEIETNCPPQCGDLFSYTETDCGEFDFTSNISINNIITAQWDFGDGNSSNAIQPHHTFVTFSSARELTLTVTFLENGVEVTKYCTELIQPNCVESCELSNFLYSVDGCTVDFTGFEVSNPTSASWDFGDGNTSDELSPTHTYASSGIYTITRFGTFLDSSGNEYEYNCRRTISVECGECACIPPGLEIKSCFNIPPFFCNPCKTGEGYVCLKTLDNIDFVSTEECKVQWFQDGVPLEEGATCPKFEVNDETEYPTTFSVEITHVECGLVFEDSLTINIDCDACEDDEGKFELRLCPNVDDIPCEECDEICVFDLSTNEVLNDPNYVVAWTNANQFFTSCIPLIPGENEYYVKIFNLSTGCQTKLYEKIPCTPMEILESEKRKFANDANDKTIKIYPNPASQYVKIYNSSDELLSAKLRNIEGKIISNLSLSANDETEFSTTNLSNGIYFLDVWDTITQEFKTHKIVVARPN